MPNLDALLTGTMLGEASPKPRWQSTWAPLPVADAPSRLDPDNFEENPIWHFDSPVFAGAGVQVANVTCRVRSMDYMKMQVLDLIEWGPMLLDSSSHGTVSLPLTPEFLISSRYVKEGTIPQSADGYWRLEANVDQSFEMVFGFEIPPGEMASPCFPIAAVDLSSKLLTPRELIYEDVAAVLHTEPGSQGMATLRVPPLRVIVVVSLVCCKERYDFVPHNVLGTGRIYPLLMAIANLPLNKLVGSVRLARPGRTMHSQIMGEVMTSKIGSAFFTDRNEPKLLSEKALPFWDDVFEYYDIDPPTGSYKVVTPSDKGRERVIRDGVWAHDGSPSALDSPRAVRKVAGQGEFDNFHLAPKMIAPASLLSLNPDLKGLENVTMAPFCVHDCFHMHFRWGDDADEIYTWGWVGQNPYAKAGAPLVPGNQEVTVQVLSPVSFRYTATAENPVPGQWQIVMHHGGAYALSFDREAFAATIAVRAEDNFWLTRNIYGEETVPWTTFYWRLRYGVYSTGQIERLTWTDQQFAALREVAAAGPVTH